MPHPSKEQYYLNLHLGRIKPQASSEEAGIKVTTTKKERKIWSHLKEQQSPGTNRDGGYQPEALALCKMLRYIEPPGPFPTTRTDYFDFRARLSHIYFGGWCGLLV